MNKSISRFIFASALLLATSITATFISGISTAHAQEGTALAFVEGPTFTTSNDNDYAKVGDTLTLTFTVNQSLAVQPNVNFLGPKQFAQFRRQTGTQDGTNYRYTYSHTLAVADFPQLNDGSPVVYAIGSLISTFFSPLAGVSATSPILIDVTAPKVTTFNRVVITTLDTPRNEFITFSERVIGLAGSDFSATEAVVHSVNVREDDPTTYAVNFTPSTRNATLTLAAHSITDLAGNTGPANDVTAGSVVANVPPVADAGPDQNVGGNERVLLSGGASHDPDGVASEVLMYSWAQTDGTTVPLGVTDVTSLIFTSPVELGPLVFTLTVTDAAGASTTDMVTVNVVNRDATNANLRSVTILDQNDNPVMLREAIEPDTRNFSASVRHDATSLDVTVVSAERGAIVRLRPDGEASRATRAYPVPDTGLLTVAFSITSEDGSNRQDYEIAITRRDNANPTVVTFDDITAIGTIGVSQQHTVTFSEPVVGFVAGDFHDDAAATHGARVNAVTDTGDQTTYTITFIPGETEFTLTLPINRVTDLDGNHGPATDFSARGTAVRNTAPTFHPNTSAESEYTENDTTEIATYRAVDAEGDPITWALTGVDAEFFTLNRDSGELTFKQSPDFEAPTDRDDPAVDAVVAGDNTYHLIVTGSDSGSPPLTVVGNVTVVVLNTDEAGAIGTISGDLEVGRELTAGAVTDLDGGVTDIIWQWQDAADDSPITSATSAPTYTLADADRGKTIQVMVTYTDGHGAGKTLTSTATATVLNTDEAGAIGAIIGAVQVGLELTAGEVTDPDGGVTDIIWQWQSAASGEGYTNIAGATNAPTYTLVEADFGKTIQVMVTYADGEGSGKTLTSAPTVAVVAISMDATLSGLTISAGTLSPDFATATMSYTAEVDNDVGSVRLTPTTANDGASLTVAGTDATSGTPSDAIDLVPDVAKAIVIVVTAADTSAAAETYTVTVTRAVNTAPRITGGIPMVNYHENLPGGVASYGVSDDDDSISTVTWGLEGMDADSFTIGNGVLEFNTAPDFETKPTYDVTVTVTDRGTPSLTGRFDVVITIVNQDEAGAVVIDGNVQVGQELTAILSDPDGGVTDIIWQWQDAGAGTDLADATSATYTLMVADLGKTIRVVATYTDSFDGGKVVTSAATAAVAGAPRPPRPILTLFEDTGSSDTDDVTSNGLVNVTLASNFDASRGDTWEWNPDPSQGFNATPGIGTSFVLPQGFYRNETTVRQTVFGAESDVARLGRNILVDINVPVINLNGSDVTLIVGETYTEQATVDDDFGIKVPLVTSGDAVNTDVLGTYMVIYDATDVAGNQAVQKSRRVTVTAPPNQEPVANAGGDQDVNTGATVTLDGTGSSDPDGTIQGYAWTHTSTDGDTPATLITLSGADTDTATFTAPDAAAVLEFQLVVTDDRSKKGTDTVTITVITPAMDATLSALSVTRGTSTVSVELSPAFDAAIERYTASVSRGTEDIRMTPSTSQSGASVAVTTPTATVASEGAASAITGMAVGENIITIIVTSADRSTTKTYTVTVTRVTAPEVQTFAVPAAGVIGERQMHDITFTEPVTDVDAGDFSESSGATVHSVEDTGDHTTYTITFTPTATSFTLLLTLNSVLDLNGGPGPYTGSQTSTVGGAIQPAPTTADLTGLTLSAGTLSPAFNAAVTDYNVNVANDVASVMVTPGYFIGSGRDSGTQTVTVNMITVTGDAASVAINLNVGVNAITIFVTVAGDATTTKTYTVTVTRAAPAKQKPVANAGVDQSVTFGATVTLDGSGSSDPDQASDSLTYSWEQTSGTPDVTLNAADTDTATFTAPDTAAMLEFELTVTDNAGIIGTDTVTITVTAPPKPVIVGSGVVSHPENSKTVATFTATDADGDPVSVTWELTGADVGLLSIGDSGRLGFTNAPDYEDPLDADNDNVYQVTITATDSATDASSELAVTVTVTNDNEPGTIADIIGIAQVGQELTAGAVTDPDGETTVTRHIWQRTPGDGGDATNVHTGNFADNTYTLVAADMGATLRVAVNYDHDAPNADFGNVFVTSAETEVVTAAQVTQSADADLTGLTIADNNGTAVVLEPIFDAAAPDTVDYTASVANGVTSVTVTPTVNHAAATLTVDGGEASNPIALMVGINALDIVVTAEDGTTKTYTVTITRAANQPPVANAGVDQSVTFGATVTLDGSASNDPDGTIERYEWVHKHRPGQLLRIVVADGVTSTFTAPDTAGVLGMLVFELTVTDDSGATNTNSDTNTVTITLTAPADTTAPTVNFGTIAEGKVEVAQEHDITFSEAVTGLARDDFSGTGVAVTAVTAVSGADNAYTLTLIPSAIAFTLTLDADSVMDAAGNPNAAASVSGTALPGNQFPIANAGAAQDVTTGAAVTLDGSGSSDPDGDALTYSWTHTSTDGGAPSPLITLTNPTTASPTFTPDTAAVLVFTMSVTDGTDASTAQVTITVTAPAANTAPVIATGSETLTQPENSERITTFTATDVDDGDTITWSLGGTDAGLFFIDRSSGRLSFTNPLDYEDPQDANSDNVYEITVTATDDGTPNESSTLNVTVTIMNVDEAGAISITGVAQVGDALTAGAVTDPDGEVSAVTYQWQADSTNIDGATDLVYTLTAADAGKTIQVVAAYTDGEGTGKSVTSAATATIINANLSGVVFTPTPDSITPAFQSGVYTYTVNVANDVESITITPTANDASASLTVDGTTAASGVASQSLTLTPGANSFDVVVTVGEFTKTYTFTIIRTQVVSANADLGGVTITDVNGMVSGLNEAITAEKTSYTATVANDASEFTVMATPDDSAALSVDVADSGEDSQTFIFTGDSVSLTVVITAQDATTKTYTVTITRAAPVATGLTATFGGVSAPNVGVGGFTTIEFSEAVTGLDVDSFSGSTGVEVNGVAGPFSNIYQISIIPRAETFTLTLAANSVTITASSPATGPAEPVSVSGTATQPEVALVFTVDPELTSNNPAPGSSPGFATVGDILTLAFSVNLPLASAPSVNIAGEAITATKGSGNDYSATWTVTEMVAGEEDDALVVYSITRMLAFGSTTNRLALGNTDSSIRFDHTAPSVVTFDPIPDVRTIDNALETHTITFSEAVTDLTISDFTATGATITDVSGAGDTYTLTFTPTETAFSLTLAADSVADLAGLTGPANDVTASGTAVAVTVNQPPVAEAGDPQSVTTGVEVTLSGSATDPDTDDVLTYSWTQTSGTPNVTLSGADTATATFTAPASATVLIFTLTVTDDSADSATNTHSDTVTITVTAPPDTPADTQNPSVMTFETTNISGIRTIGNALETYSVTFSEPVTAPGGTPLGHDIFSKSTGATVTALTDSGDQTRYTITFTPTATAFTLIITSLSVRDLSGNSGPRRDNRASGRAQAPAAVVHQFGTFFDASIVGKQGPASFIFGEAVTGVDVAAFSGSTGVTIDSVRPVGTSTTNYRLRITPTEETFTLLLAANSVTITSSGDMGPAEPVSVTRTALPALVFTAGPVLASSNAGDYTENGDTLTLTFTVSLPLTGDPSVTIAGQTVTATKGSGNDYTATYTVVAAEVTDGAVVYDLSEMTATNHGDNTFDPDAVTSSILIDVVAPSVTTFITPDADGMLDAQQTHSITFSEPVTGLDSSTLATVITSTGGVTVDSVADTNSDQTTYDIAFTPTERTFDLTLAANSVTDLAGRTGPASEVTVSGVAVGPPVTITTLPALVIKENNQVVTRLTAEDGDGNDISTAVTWTVTGGADRGAIGEFFENELAWSLAVNTNADFETPLDADRNNIYEITLTATDSDGASDDLEVTITVEDANDRGSVGVIGGRAQVGQELTAGAISDQDVGTGTDGAYTDITYVWQADGNAISGATSETYMLTAAEAGKKIRVAVTYTDVHGTETANSRETVAVVAETVIEPPTLALADDTNIDGDYITSNPVVNVLLSSDFDSARGDTWEYSTNSGNSFTVGSDTSFTLDANRSYAAGWVQAVQTLDGVKSAANPLGDRVITVDSRAPEITLLGEVTVPLTVGDPAYADAGATATDVGGDPVDLTSAITTLITFAGDTVSTVNPDTVGDYTITYDVSDLAGNAAMQVERTVVVSAPTPFAVTIPALGKSTVGQPANVRISLGASVTGLMADDFEVTNASLGTLSGSGTDYVLVYTPTTAGAVTLTLAADRVTDTNGNPNLVASATGTAVVAAMDTEDKPRFIARMTIAGLTTAEFDEDKFVMGIAGLLAIEAADVRVLSIAAGSVVVDYEVIADTVAARDARATALSTASELDLRTATGQALPDDAAVTTTPPEARQPAINTAPRIDNDAAVDYAENTDPAVTPAVATFTADDDESNTITWALTGTDASFFTLDGTSGALTFNAPPDFEDAQDTDTNNEYQVTVTATDDGTPNATSTLEVTVTVTNEDEEGAIGAIIGIVQVGQELTAGEVTDPDSPDVDSPVTVTTYQWQSAASGGGDYTDISGATNAATYTLTADEIDQTIQVMVTYTDGHGAGKTLTSAATGTVVAVPAPAPPSLTLALDTGSSQTDGITQNGQVNVTLAGDFDAARGDTWKYSTNSGGDFTEVTDSTVTSFTLDDGNYAAGTVQVVQTLLSVDSAAASLGAVTVDNTAPEIEVNTDPATITLTLGDAYIERATVTDNVDASVAIITTGELVNPNTAGRYRLVYTATDVAGNAARKVRLVLVQPVLAFAAGAEPALSSNGATVDGVTYAKADDILSLTFSVNLPLASEPSVTIAGQSATVTSTGNSYTAAYTVVAARVTDGALAAYDIDAMTAADNPTNALDPEVVTSAIQIDVTAPTIPNVPLTFSPRAPDGGRTHIRTDDELTITLVSSEALSAESLLGAVQLADKPALDLQATSDPLRYEVVYKVQAGDNNLNTNLTLSGVADPAGNEFTETTWSYDIHLDGIPPAVHSRGSSGNTINDQLRLTIRFTEVVIGLEAEDFVGEGATVEGVSSDRFDHFIIFTPIAANFTLTLKAETMYDLADDGPAEQGNAGPVADFVVVRGTAETGDTTAPTVTTFEDITAVGNLADAQEYEHTITFSEAVTGLAISDFSTSTGATVNRIAPDSGFHRTYTITFTPTAATFALILAAESVTDRAALTGPATAARADGTLTPSTSMDADLSGLTIADNNDIAVVLDPIFNAASPDTVDYTASVANGITSVTLTPTTADAAASVTVAGGEASNPIALNVGINALDIVVTAEDGTTKTYTVTVTRAGNSAPDLSGNEASPMVAENTPITTAVTTYRATDVENNTIAWTLTGTDAGLFRLDPSSGALTFNTSPDYESPQDTDADNEYQVTVTATDDGTPSETSTLEVTVTVTNEDEEGTIGAITGTAQVGQTLTAGMVTDPDSPSTSVTVTNYQWQSDSTDIDSATSETYTPLVADIGKTIQVMVTYTDGHAAGKTLTSAETAAVIAAPVTVSADANLSGLTIADNNDIAVVLDPIFNAASPDTVDYTASVANGITSVTLTPTTADAAASVTVAGGEASNPIALNVGINALDIVVTAEDGTTKTYTVTVTRAAPPNQPPVANAGADQSVTTDATVTLSGSATDPDQASDSLTYLWTQTSGTPAVTLNAADTATAEFTAPDVATVLVFTLTVTDDAGISDTDTVTITVTAPLAFSAGPALTNNSLFASGDFAADGNTLTLTFSVNQALANPPSVVFSGHDRFTDVYTPFATVTATKDVGDNNDYTAEYTVVAAAVDPQQDQVVGYDIGAMVAADNPDNTFDPVPADVDIQIDVRAPTASFGSLPALFVDRSAAVRLTIDDEGAHQSLTTADVTATNAKDLALARVTGTDEHEVTFTPVAAGEVVITFNSTGRVTDSAGNVIAAASAAGTAVLSADADLSSLTLADNNGMAVVLEPIFDAAAPDTVDYTASVDNEVTSVTVTPSTADAAASVTVAGTDTTSGTASGANNLNVGANEIRVVVTAEDGSTTKTYTVTVTRGAPPNQPPVANAGADQSVTTGTEVTLTGTGSSDPDTDDALTYAWVHTSTDDAPPATDIPLTNADTATATFTAPDTAAVLVFTLTVTDDSGDSATNTNADTVTITVTAPLATGLTATFGGVSASSIGVGGFATLEFSEAVTGLDVDSFSGSRGVEVTSVAGPFGTNYIINLIPRAETFTLTLAANSVTITATSPATGPAEPVSVEGTATQPEVALVFTVDPELTSNNPAPGSSPGFATVGDMLTLAFSVNLPLASAPSVNIAGEAITATKGSGNDYSATWTVTEKVAGENDDALVVYGITRMLAFGSTTNRLALGNTDSAIRFDHTAPSVVTFDPIPDVRTIDDALETHTITFSEAVTDLAISDFTATGATITDVSGAGDTYTITFTPTETAFSLTLAADSVADLAGLTGPATAATANGTAVVATVNQPPVANAGADQDVTTGVEVTLTGSATDPDDNDDALTYSWAHTSTDGDTPATVIPLTNADTATATFTAPDTAAVLVFTLTVTDDSGDSATNTNADTVTITVTAPVATNQPPVAEAGDPQSVTTGTVVTLTGSATDPDTDDVLTYAWAHTSTDGDTPATVIPLTNADTATATFTAPASAAVLIFTLTVTDDSGDSATNTHTDTVTITVTAPVVADTTPPLIVLIGDATVILTVGGTYTDAGATATDNVDDNLALTALIAAAGTVDTNTAGTYTITYNVSDAANNAAAPVTRTVVVQPVLALTAGPTLTNSNTVTADGNYATIGDTLTLAFTVNLPLASVPSVTIAGQAATVVEGTGNSYTATYSVDAADVTDGALVSYDIGAMTAVDNADNRLDPEVATSAIQIDITAPTATFTPDSLTGLLVDTAATITLNISDEGEHQSLALTDFTAVNAKDLSFAVVSGSSEHAVTFTPLAAGLVSVTFNNSGRVTDGAGNVIAAVTASGTALPPPNQPPVAEAGDAQEVETGVEVTLSGSATDPESGVLTYLWTHTSTDEVAPPATPITLSDPTAASPTFTADTAAVLVFTLTVTDDSGDSATNTHSDTVTITVTEPEPGPTASWQDRTDILNKGGLIVGVEQENGVFIDLSEMVEDLVGGDFSDSIGVRVNAQNPPHVSGGFYRVAFTPTATSFTLIFSADSITGDNGKTGPAEPVSITGTAEPALAVTAHELTSSNAGDYAIDGDTLSLAFTVNLPLASDPTVSIAGQSATVVKGDGNSYSATWTVTEAVAAANDGNLVAYSISGLVSASSARNTHSLNNADSAIRFDHTAPTVVTFITPDDNGVIGVQQTHDITFSEPVTGLDSTTLATVITTTGGVTVDSVTDTDGDQTIYAITFTPTAASFSLTLAANSVADLAGLTAPATAQTATGTATAPLSTNVDLVSLTIIDNNNVAVALTPIFDADADTVNYTASVDNEVTSVTVTADYATGTSSGTQTVTVNMISVDDNVASEAINLNVGANDIAIVVTAENGTTTKTYTVTVTRAADTTPPRVFFGTIAEGEIDEELEHDFTFDEAVTGLTVSDFTVVGARITNLDGSGDAYIISFIPSANTFTLTLAANSVTDLNGNDGPAADPVADRRVSGTATGTAANIAPVANAGADQSVTFGATVTLSGSGSSDSDGTIQSYAWTHTSTDGDTPATVIPLTNADTDTATFTAPATAAELVFTLTVTDDSGDSATNTGEDTVTITVTAPVATNQPPVADAGDAQSVTTGATVTLTGSATDPDDNDDALTYSWTHTSTDGDTPATPITLSGGTTATATFTPDTAAVLVFTLTVTDDSGDSATNTNADTVTITVTAPLATNQPPVANAGDDQSVTTGTEVTLTGSATDPDGDALTYSWTQTSGTNVTLSNTAIAGPTFTAPDTAAELVFTLTVTDDSGDSATNTGTVTITIAAPVATNQPPVADAGDAQEVDTGATVTLTGSATDPDTDAADTDTATFTAPATAAELVFTLTVTDDSGDSATSTGEDTVTITVTAPVTNTAPVAEAGDAQEVIPAQQ